MKNQNKLSLKDKLNVVLISDVPYWKENIKKIPEIIDLIKNNSYIVQNCRGCYSDIKNSIEEIEPKYKIKGSPLIYEIILEKIGLKEIANEMANRATGNPFHKATYTKK